MKPNRKLKANLVRAGIKQTEIAKQAGVSPSAVCRLLSGKIKSRNIESTINKALARPAKTAA